MGDSITQRWWLPSSNLGLSGDTTAGMLKRFPLEVLQHDYRAVVILGGTNDMRLTGASIEEEAAKAMSNIAAMAAIADAAGITVVLCTIPPIQGEESRSEGLNAEITSFAESHHYKLVNYYTPMSGHPEYFVDYLHPNVEGYMVMRSALIAVLPQNY